MAASKNVAAATLTREAAEKAGVLTFNNAAEVATKISSNTRKLFGFTRKQLPPGLPEDPVAFIYSISEYGEEVSLCAGLPAFRVHGCPEGQEYGPALPIKPIYFLEEAKVDVTEHTPHTAQQIVEAILKIGPGMNAGWDRRKQGWFVSATNPPAAADIARAKEIYLMECKRLFTEGQRWAQAGKLDEINETHRRAARVMGQKVDWDRPALAMVECPGCGENVRKGAIMHAVPYCGFVFNWHKAIEGGMKKLEDAPDSVLKELQGK